MTLSVSLSDVSRAGDVRAAAQALGPDFQPGETFGFDCDTDGGSLSGGSNVADTLEAIGVTATPEEPTAALTRLWPEEAGAPGAAPQPREGTLPIPPRRPRVRAVVPAMTTEDVRSALEAAVAEIVPIMRAGEEDAPEQAPVARRA